MPELAPQFTESALLTYSETLRRALYDACTRLIWEPVSPEERVPTYTPDQANLMILFTFGRWICAWTDLDEPANAPADRRTQVVRVLAAPGSRFGVIFQEI